MELLNILLMGMGPEATGEDGGGGYSQFVFLFVIIIVFYFFFIRPQTKKAKDERKFREALKKGDKIITLGGVHGKIIEVSETTVIIEVENQGRLKIEKSAIQLTPAAKK